VAVQRKTIDHNHFAIKTNRTNWL